MTARMEPIAVTDLASIWRARADELERYGVTAGAVGIRDCAQQLEQALRDAAGEVLTLQEAALRSGLSVNRLRHQVAAGEIPNAGRKHAPRIRAGDLPRSARRSGPTLYDVDADARQLAGGPR